MALMQTFFMLVLVGLLVIHFLRRLRSRRRYPPGPLPIPVLGGLWQTGIRLYQDTLTKPVKQNGNTEQPAALCLHAITNGKDLVFSNGHLWKQQKVIGQMTMQKLGLVKDNLERQIKEEAQQLLETLAYTNGQPLDPLLPITNSVCNVVCAVAFGHRFSVGDKGFQKLIEAIDFALKCGGSFVYALYEIFPQLMEVLPGRHKKALSSREMVISFAKKEIEMHKKHQTLREPQDFIDFYLFQMKKQSKGNLNALYNEHNLALCVLDLFISATESTATTLQWALLLMATHPDIQGKVQKEMRDVFGSTRSICYQDWKKLPYTTAVIHEIQRAKYALLFGIIQQFVKDVNIFGFLIPKGTFLNPDLHSVLIDPKQWEMPEKFNPNNFLDKDGHFTAREQFLLFGSGDHVGLGEQLARIELFVFLTSLLREFTFQLPEGGKAFSKEPETGLTSYPHSYRVCVVPRFKAS